MAVGYLNDKSITSIAKSELVSGDTFLLVDGLSCATTFSVRNNRS